MLLTYLNLMQTYSI